MKSRQEYEVKLRLGFRNIPYVIGIQHCWKWNEWWNM